MSSSEQVACMAGFARERLDVRDGFDMCGYGPMAKAGAHDEDELYASALYLRGGEGEVVFVAVDLHSASTWLLYHLDEELRGEGLGEGKLILAGTHTHTAPGRYHGNTFYDTFLQDLELLPGRRFRRRLAETIVKNVATAVRRARDRAAPAEIGFAHANVWGHHANRSLVAFRANKDAERWSTDERFPGGGAPDDLEPEHRFVDPRVRVIAAFDPGGQLIGSLATFGCHATSLGAAWTSYDRDWPGVAVDVAEGRLGEERVALAMSGGGDVSPLSPEYLRPGAKPEEQQGEALRDERGAAIGAAIVDAVEAAREGRRAVPVSVDSMRWKPPSPGAWSVGWPTLGGAEDARSSFARRGGRCFQEGYKRGRGPRSQVPKARVRILSLFKWVCRLSPYHQIHRVTLGDHVVVTVPGEPTAMAAVRIERNLEDKLPAGSVHVVSYAGDYCGYFTTEEEYDEQHYEGSTTVYGSRSLEMLIKAYLGPMDEKAALEAPVFAIATEEEMQAALAEAHALLAEGPAITDVDEVSTTVMFHHPGEALDGVVLQSSTGEPIAIDDGPVDFGGGLWLTRFDQALDDPTQAVLVYGAAKMVSAPIQPLPKEDGAG